MGGSLTADIVTSEEFSAFLGAHQTVVVGFFKEPASVAARMYAKFACNPTSYTNLNRSWFPFPFGITSEEAIFEAAGAHDGQIIVLQEENAGSWSASKMKNK